MFDKDRQNSLPLPYRRTVITNQRTKGGHGTGRFLLPTVEALLPTPREIALLLRSMLGNHGAGIGKWMERH